MMLHPLLHALALQAHAAPATVLDHTLEVRVDSGRRLSHTQIWTVRIDDPAACAAGIEAPPGLDGSMDGDALVLGTLLVVPGDVAKGDTFTLTATGKASRGSHSGVFSTAPDLPLEKAHVTITGPGHVPLTVWADPRGDLEWSTRRNRVASITWSDLEGGDPARVVWSSWPDWLAPGKVIDKAVDGKMAGKLEMGKEIAEGLDSSNLPEISRRVFQHVALIPDTPGSFQDARKATDVIDSREGTSAERAIVLLSMLRAAGYVAQPAYYRQTSARGEFPITVPSPTMLDQPLIRVEDRSGGVRWVDPSGDAVTVPDIPSTLIGATVWVSGDLPTRLRNDAVVNGTIVINTSATIDRKGDVTWSASIDTQGTAHEWLRRLLGPLEDAEQQQALMRLVRQSRPELTRFSMNASGTRDPYKKLKITLSGHDSAVFVPFAAGMRGEVVPVLAPAMAAWLPPKIRVLEILDISGPQNLVIVANSKPTPAYGDDALLDREARRAGPRLRMRADAVRPYGQSSSARDAAAAAFLGAEANKGVEVLLYPPPTPPTAKAIRALELPAPERAAIEALLWWGAGNDKRARKVLKKALPVHGLFALAQPLTVWLDPGDTRPWQAFSDLVDPNDHPARRTMMRAMEQNGFPRLAWFEAASLSDSTDPAIAAEALLTRFAHQGAKPDTSSDPKGAAIWMDPSKLIALAEAKCTEAGVFEAEMRLAKAEWALDSGKDAGAAVEALQGDDTARAAVLRLTIEAPKMSHAAVREEATAALFRAPTDSMVASRSAQALTRIGDHEAALELGMIAARVGHEDAGLWQQASQLALSAGKLPLALECARRASDLKPEDKNVARSYHQIATMALDEAAEGVARQRAGLPAPTTWPPTVDDLMAIAPPSALLALLQHHESAVVASPIMLRLRAQLRTDAGLFDEAARDSINLQRLHGEPEGPALAFAATAGRVFGTGAIRLLDDVSTDVARLTRMEYRMLTGSGDPRQDARVLKDEPRAQDVLLTAGSPAEAAAGVEGWPSDLENTRTPTPKGYKVNPLLSAVEGVSGFSQPDRQLAIVRVHGVTEVLPPPLSLLYTPHSPPLEQIDRETVLIRLDGGNLPVYAVRRTTSDTTYGIGFTPSTAKRALADSE